MSNPLGDMEKPDVIFAIGTNMTECHPVAAIRLKRAQARGAKLIVADPRNTELAQIADLHLPLRVGTDAALLLAMAHVIQRDNLTDTAFIETRTNNGNEFLKHVTQFSPDWAANLTGIAAADIEQAARWYGKTNKAAIFYTLGITQHVGGTDNVQSLCNLSLMTGNLGREGTGINPMRGQNNVQGSGDAGALPAVYPGYQPVTDPKNQKKFQDLYGKSADLEAGISKTKAFFLAGSKIHAMLIDGENSLVSDANRNHTQKALDSLEHLVVIDIFLSQTAKLADVVLPASSWAETDGTCTNTERRIQRVRAALPPKGQAKPDWWIISELAKRLGFEGFHFQTPREIFNELCKVSPIYNGLHWDRVEKGEYQWPVPSKNHPGTSILHKDVFSKGKADFKLVTFRKPGQSVNSRYPTWLTTGRRLETYHTNTQVVRSEGMETFVPEEILEVHPDDVSTYMLKDGGFCRVTSAKGSIDIKVRATSRSPRGTVFTSFSFDDTPVNKLTGSGYDRVTETPEYKACPVSIEPI